MRAGDIEPDLPRDRSDPYDKLMAEALALAHVVKYADHRLAGIGGVMGGDGAESIGPSDNRSDWTFV